jgi:30S ribosomal protein S31
MSTEAAPASHPASPVDLPTRQTLADRILCHQEEKRRSLNARRRVGAAMPTEAEVAAVLAARHLAAARAHDAALQEDVTRIGATALRCYDVTLDDDSTQTFQPPTHLSDVQVRQDLVRPLNKLMAILALRQRFAKVLKTLLAARETAPPKHNFVDNSVGAEKGVCGGPVGDQLPLPSATTLPPLSTLLRSLPLPEIATYAHLNDNSVATHASAQLYDTPHSRTFHDPFVFRLRHYTPVKMPAFIVDIAAQADREMQSNVAAATPPAEGTEVVVPAMAAPLPSLSPSPNANLFNGADEALRASGLTVSLAAVSASARTVPQGQVAPATNAGSDADAGEFIAVIPHYARPINATNLMQPQAM